MTKKPRRITAAELARITGYSRAAISNFIRTGLLARGRDGKLNHVESLERIQKHEQTRARDGKRLGENADLKGRLLELRGDRIAFELDVARQKYLPIDDVVADVTRCTLSARAVLLSLPNSIGASLGPDAERIARSKVHEALTILSENPLNKQAIEAALAKSTLVTEHRDTKNQSKPTEQNEGVELCRTKPQTKN